MTNGTQFQTVKTAKPRDSSVTSSDAQNTSLCLAATGNDGAPIELEKCNDTGAWNDAGSYYLFNGDYGESGSLDAQAIGTHDYLYAVSGTDGGKYRQWTVYGWN